jgi:hypothetical protein
MPDEQESEPIAFMLPGMTAEVIGNCVLMKCKSEEDAIILLEAIHEMDGKNVILEVREESNG